MRASEAFLAEIHDLDPDNKYSRTKDKVIALHEKYSSYFLKWEPLTLRPNPEEDEHCIACRKTDRDYKYQKDRNENRKRYEREFESARSPSPQTNRKRINRRRSTSERNIAETPKRYPSWQPIERSHLSNSPFSRKLRKVMGHDFTFMQDQLCERQNTEESDITSNFGSLREKFEIMNFNSLPSDRISDIKQQESVQIKRKIEDQKDYWNMDMNKKFGTVPQQQEQEAELEKNKSPNKIRRSRKDRKNRTDLPSSLTLNSITETEKDMIDSRKSISHSQTSETPIESYSSVKEVQEAAGEGIMKEFYQQTQQQQQDILKKRNSLQHEYQNSLLPDRYKESYSSYSYRTESDIYQNNQNNFSSVQKDTLIRPITMNTCEDELRQRENNRNALQNQKKDFIFIKDQGFDQEKEKSKKYAISETSIGNKKLEKAKKELETRLNDFPNNRLDKAEVSRHKELQIINSKLDENPKKVNNQEQAEICEKEHFSSCQSYLEKSNKDDKSKKGSNQRKTKESNENVQEPVFTVQDSEIKQIPKKALGLAENDKLKIKSQQNINQDKMLDIKSTKSVGHVSKNINREENIVPKIVINQDVHQFKSESSNRNSKKSEKDKEERNNMDSMNSLKEDKKKKKMKPKDQKSVQSIKSDKSESSKKSSSSRRESNFSSKDVENVERSDLLEEIFNEYMEIQKKQKSNSDNKLKTEEESILASKNKSIKTVPNLSQTQKSKDEKFSNNMRLMGDKHGKGVMAQKKSDKKASKNTVEKNSKEPFEDPRKNRDSLVSKNQQSEQMEESDIESITSTGTIFKHGEGSLMGENTDRGCEYLEDRLKREGIIIPLSLNKQDTIASNVQKTKEKNERPHQSHKHVDQYAENNSSDYLKNKNTENNPQSEAIQQKKSQELKNSPIYNELQALPEKNNLDTKKDPSILEENIKKFEKEKNSFESFESLENTPSFKIRGGNEEEKERTIEALENDFAKNENNEVKENLASQDQYKKGQEIRNNKNNIFDNSKKSEKRAEEQTLKNYQAILKDQNKFEMSATEDAKNDSKEDKNIENISAEIQKEKQMSAEIKPKSSNQEFTKNRGKEKKKGIFGEDLSWEELRELKMVETQAAIKIQRFFRKKALQRKTDQLLEGLEKQTQISRDELLKFASRLRKHSMMTKGLNILTGKSKDDQFIKLMLAFISSYSLLKKSNISTKR